MARGRARDTLGAVRSSLGSLTRRGGRTVLHGYPSLGLGNYLYFLLHADAEQARGRDYRVVRPELMDYWAPLLPGVEEQLTVHPDAVRLRDRRDEVPGTFFQRFGPDFDRDQLAGFIERFVVGSPSLREVEDLGGSDTLTVNVRRGDYYSNPVFRQLYGFDVAAYVRIGLELCTRNGGAPRRIRVVSDGMDWCRSELAWLADHAEEVTYAAPEDGPMRNFLQIALSRRLIITNSTFSYWGAYISNVVHADNHAQVVAPRFHSHGLDGGRAWQLDPRWDVVESLPGGWGPV